MGKKDTVRSPIVSDGKGEHVAPLNTDNPADEQPTEDTKSPIVPPPESVVPRDGYNATAAYTSNKEWEEDRRALAKARHDALNGFLQASVYQRSELLRDTLAVSVTILFGALTLYFTSGPDHSIIKTVSLFFFGLFVLILGIIANLLARADIITHLQAISHQIEQGYLNVFEASRNLMKNPSQLNIDTAYRVEGTPYDFPILSRRGNYGHTITLWAIIICVASLTASFVLTVRF
jgi:hypothetical protein